MSGQESPGGAVGVCALSATAALGIPAAVYLGAGPPGSAGTGVGALSATVLVGVLAAIGAVVQTRRSRPVPAVCATGLFVLSTGFAVFQVPALVIADAAAGACCLFFIIGLQMPGAHDGDRAGSRSRVLEEFRYPLLGGLIATPGLIVGSMVPAQPSALVGIAAGLLVVAVMVGVAKRMV